MALDAADIERIKAAIPINHRPAPEAAGKLSDEFLSVDLLRKSTPLQGSEKADRYNLGIGFVEDRAGDPGTASPSFILSGAQANARDARLTQTEQRKRDEERRYVTSQIVSQIEARNRQIAENLKRLEALQRQETALDRHLARLARGEKAELDDEGHLRDKEAEAAIREYEERYGVRVDRNDADQIAVILQGVRDQQLQIRRENEDLAADNERDRQLAIDMGADPASIPATIRALEANASGQRSVDSATAKLGGEEQRRAVVDAVFEEGSEDHQWASEQVAQDAGFQQSETVVIDGVSDIAPASGPATKPPRPS